MLPPAPATAVIAVTRPRDRSMSICVFALAGAAAVSAPATEPHGRWRPTSAITGGHRRIAGIVAADYQVGELQRGANICLGHGADGFRKLQDYRLRGAAAFPHIPQNSAVPTALIVDPRQTP